MAPPDQPSQRHHESGTRKHKKRKSSSRKPASSSEGTKSTKTLSVDALAALNQANARGSSSRDVPEDIEARERQEQERQERRERRRRRESRAKVDRDDYREIDNRDSPRRERKRRESRPTEEYRDVDAGSDYHNERRAKRKREPKTYTATRVPRDEVDSDNGHERRRREHKEKKRRMVSGAILEEGKSKSNFMKSLRGGGTNSSSYDSLEKEDIYYDPVAAKKKKKRLWIAAGVSLVVLLIIIVVAVVVSKKNSGASSDSSSLTSNLDGVDPSTIPSGAPDYLNPFTWYDTRDFNVTYTAVLVGDLPIMGLNSTWDDSAAPNDNVPALSTAWGSYADRPARGVNLGGWLSIEPWITPDLFNYDSGMGIVDEYTLCQHLGSGCASTLEAHYSSFVTEETFAEIADAGLDHIRIPYSYWAVQTYDSDPYLYRASWRYLLRGIEWARKYGLRINLDLHGLPGSQNGWNHSGRLGPIGWFNGTDGDLNVQRSIDVHDRLSKFFAQDRYKNIISHYGLANEPKMTVISVNDVVNWTETVFSMVRANGVDAIVVFGDGFRGLESWQGEMTGYSNLALDVHQYVIFNNAQIVYNHTAKVSYACEGWTEQTDISMDTTTGFGPTLVAEWSQADTDCAQYLNNVGWGNRWTGTYDTGNASDPLQALTPRCPTEDDQCSCTGANADPSTYSDDYKQFLLYFAQAQMDSFEKGWGWFYWTWWTTGSTTQWSYKKGMAAGILPAKAYDRSFHCNSTAIPSFSGLAETF